MGTVGTVGTGVLTGTTLVAAASSSPRYASDLEQARPQTSGEEELQLQLALAMSREEAEKVRPGSGQDASSSFIISVDPGRPGRKHLCLLHGWARDVLRVPVPSAGGEVLEG